MNRTFKTIDLFAGIGGIRLGFEMLNRSQNVFSAEIDRAACTTYKLNFNEDPYCDVTKLDKNAVRAIPDFDILLAGFPCQAFSIAGKGNGFNDSRGTLFFDVARILDIKRPQAFLLENAKGLVSHKSGNTLKAILKVLIEELNYNVYYKVLNSKDFGVPQNRERIYIVGFLEPMEFNFPSAYDREVTVSSILEKEVSVKYYLSQKYWDTLKKHKARHESKGNGFGYKIIESHNIANAIVVGGMGRERNLIRDYAPGDRVVNINDAFVRRMTPREWARLQGYPDSFRIHPVDTQAYRQLGNSVTVPVISSLAERLFFALDRYEVDKSITTVNYKTA